MADFAGKIGHITKATETFEGLRIEGVVVDGTFVDCDREQVDYATTKPYFEATKTQMLAVSGGKSVLPIRLQHDSQSPVSRCSDMRFDDAAETITVIGDVYDPYACQLIEEGVLSMLSMGGEYIKRWPKLDANGNPVTDAQGRPVVMYTAAPFEVSVVDKGCCDACTMSYAAKAFELSKGGAITKVVPREMVDRLPSNGEDECDQDDFPFPDGDGEGECDMTEKDHKKMSEWHEKAASHHKALHELHKTAALHHTEMGKAGPASFGEAAAAGAGMPDTAGKAVKTAYGTPGTYGGYGSDNDASGGLRKAQ